MSTDSIPSGYLAPLLWISKNKFNPCYMEGLVRGARQSIKPGCTTLIINQFSTNFMKKITWAICLMAVLPAFGQDCARFLFFQKGKTIEMTIYNKAGEVNGRQIYQVLDVSNSGATTTSSLTSEMFDKSGKSLAKTTSSFKCSGGQMMVDMKMMVPQQSPGSNTVDAKMDNGYLEFPASLHVGDQLKDGNMTMTMTMQNMQETMVVNITDRKVLAQETVTTPAGSWSCFKISAKSTVTVNMAGHAMPPMSTESTSWYAPGFGLIKTLSANGSTLITSIK